MRKIVFILSLIFIFYNPLVLSASSADLTFTTEEEILSETFELNLGGYIPTDISSFEIEINYNQDAFTFVEGYASTHQGISNLYNDKNGVLQISGTNNGGVIPLGDQLLSTFVLRAKNPGTATIVLLNSKFISSTGSPVPGTTLRYFTITNNQQTTTTTQATTIPPITTEVSLTTTSTPVTVQTTTQEVTTSSSTTTVSNLPSSETQQNTTDTHNSTENTTLSIVSSSSNPTPSSTTNEITLNTTSNNHEADRPSRSIIDSKFIVIASIIIVAILILVMLKYVKKK